MTLYYFKEKIEDELDGSKDYIKRALEIKPMNPEWGKNLVDMSAAELAHAKHLFAMFQEFYKKLKEEYGNKMPAYMEKINDDINEMYTECSAKIKYLHEMY